MRRYRRYDNPEIWTPIKEGEGPLIGLEIELEHDKGEDAVDFEFCFTDTDYVAAVKEDGSIEGAEFVTQPATLEAHRKRLPKLLDYLKEMGFYEMDRCGVHVHIERRFSGFSNSSFQEKALFALLNCSTEYWDMLTEEVYGRDGYFERDEGYAIPYSKCRSESVLTTEGGDIRFFLGESAEKNRLLLRHKKFLRVNFCHEDTVEFRQGRGTMSFAAIMRYVECSLALMEFSAKRENLVLSPKDEARTFLTSVSESKYPGLYRYLQEGEVQELLEKW